MLAAMQTPHRLPPAPAQAPSRAPPRWRAAGAVLLAGLLLAVVWLWPLQVAPVPGTVVAPASVAMLAVPPAAWPAASAPMAGAAPAAASAQPGPEADCGASITPLAKLRAVLASALPDDSQLAALLARVENEEDTAQRAGAAAHAAAVQRLRASADPVQQAAGLYILASPRPAGPMNCQGDDCSEAMKQLEQSGVAPLAELAALARETTSAQVYGWAWSACNMALYKGWGPPGCVGLSPQRWAQLAPESAWPWLAQATQARQAGDVAGEVSAMHRAGGAANWRSDSGSLLRLLLAAQPQGLQGLPRLHSELQALMTDITTVAINVPMGLGSFCGRAMDANRQQTCAAMADRLLSQADNLLHLGLGIAVAERSGLPAARTAALRQERDLLMKQTPSLDAVQATNAVTACAGMAQMRQYIARQATLGELGVLRERLAASSPVLPAASSAPR